MSNKMLSTRKGISSIVGSFFFLILMFAAFGAILVAFQYQSDIVAANREISNAQSSKILEQFSLRPIISGSGPCTLNPLYIDNTGTNSIEIVDLWITTSGSQNIISGPIAISSPVSFVPPGTSGQFLTSGISGIGVGTHVVKAITALGNIRSTTFTCPKTVSTDDEDTIKDKLIAKPNVYAAFPNPITGGQEGYIGLVVANPTGFNMYVNRTSIQAISPLNPNFYPTTAPQADSSLPTTPSDSDFSDQIGWYNDKYTLTWGDAAKTIPPYSAYEFKIRIKAASATNDATIITMNTNSLSSYGQFGSTKIDTTASYQKTYAFPNVYLSPDSTSGGVTYYISGKAPGISTQYNFTLKNTGGSSTMGKIKKDAIVVVNIPKYFGTELLPPTPVTSGSKCNAIIVNANNVADPTAVLIMPDKSFQIRYKTTVALAKDEFITCAFTATNPTPTSPKLYALYVYAIGLVDENVSSNPTSVPMGPVAETVVQVCHMTPTGNPPTCPTS